MRNTRRLAVIGLSVVAAGALLAGTAAADVAGAHAYNGSASADALTISVFGQTITTSASTADINDALAKATSTQVLTPAVTDGMLHAEAAPGESKDDAPAKCTGSDLTAIPGISRSDITCGSAHADLSATGGSARGIGAEVALEPSVSGLLSKLQLQQPVQDGTKQIFSQAIDPLVKQLTGNPVGDLVSDASTSLQEVLNNVLSLQTTARIVVAPALAEVTADANSVVSHAHAQGIRIELLPVAADAATNGLLPADLVPGKPLVTITIGNAEATKTVPRGGGQATGDAHAALVTIEFGSSALTDALGLHQASGKPFITVEAGQSMCVLPMPLETCVTVASAKVDAATGDASADGTSVQVFKGINGGIDLATGRASTAGAATPLALTLPAAAELPRTGGNATLPLIGGALLCLALVTRRLSFGRR